MELLLLISVSLLAGLFMSRVANLFKLPAVTAYLIAGILIGPFCLGRLGIPGVGYQTLEQVKSLEIISDAAMGFIAFSIGNEFRLSQLRENGRQATLVGIVQAVAATVLVDLVLVGLHFLIPDVLSIPAAITLGAIAAATAPAATLMVVRQYRAKGPLTNILLPVVALDDAVGLAIFSISFGVARSLTSGAVDPLSVIVEPIVEVVLSLLLGAVTGFVFNFAEKFFHSRAKRMSIAVAFVLLDVAISNLEFRVGPINCGFSSLLACMMLGTIFCNICDVSQELMDRAERWTGPLNVMFFVLSGAELDFGVIGDVMIIGIGVCYIISRSLGKYLGASWSAKLAGCNETIVKYLGITLLPQAGVALGMSVMAESLGADGVIIRNIVLFSVMVYELVGPTLTKISLAKAGEIPQEQENVRGKQDVAKDIT